jgi:tryptophan synthase beta chain
MVRVSYQQKPYRKSLMRVWGAECIPSPSKRTKTGCAILEKNPKTSGSLGIAISEAVEDAASHDDTNYSLGSVLNHVCLHQTIIGLETQQQFLAIEDYPDIVMGCCGGGSNFAGMAFPFVGDKIRRRHPEVRILSCEPAACPTLTKGLYTYDFGDAAGLTPLLKMYTLGHDFVPPPIHAGGLRYHGDSPLLCQLTQQGIMEAKSFHQTEVFDAAQLFAHTEGLIVAPEAAHAVKGVVEEALICKKTGKDKTILFNNSGHGSFDLSSYDAYLDGQLVDYEYPESLVQEAMDRLPQLS